MIRNRPAGFAVRRPGRKDRAGRVVAAIAIAAGACAPIPETGSGTPPLPPPSGTVEVREGDSLSRIARRHGVSLRDLIEVNRASPPYRIYPGQELRLPGRSATAAEDPSRNGGGRAAPRSASGVSTVESGAPAEETQAERSSANAESSNGLRPPEGGTDFMWPLEGRILARYGRIGDGRRNDGINIAGRRGDPVRAVADGTVSYAGNEIRGFGNLLLVRHADGWISAYAHNERVLVRKGERVRKGQVVSRVGSTGNVGGPQLHFELRRNDRLVDPERHLPRTR